MPMPPPRASTEGPRDRQVFHEMGQIVRALEAIGPQTPEDLAATLGAAYWESDRFHRPWPTPSATVWCSSRPTGP